MNEAENDDVDMDEVNEQPLLPPDLGIRTWTTSQLLLPQLPHLHLGMSWPAKLYNVERKARYWKPHAATKPVLLLAVSQPLALLRATPTPVLAPNRGSTDSHLLEKKAADLAVEQEVLDKFLHCC